MEEAIRRRVEEIAAQMECPEDFRCARSGFERLCKARAYGLDNILECLEEVPTLCRYAVPYGYVNFCLCPLRTFIAQELGK